MRRSRALGAPSRLPAVVVVAVALSVINALVGGLSRARAAPSAPGDEARRPLLLARRDLAAPLLFELRREATARGLEVAAPEPRADPASEAVLAEVRPLYRDMAWTRCTSRLDAGVDALIRAREPSPGMVQALAELELWRGACRLLGGNARSAGEHFTLARQLSATAKLEPIFPPRVRAAARAARPGRPIPVTVRVAPVGAHVWLDGRLVDARQSLSATPGLHVVVVGRADFVPEAQFVRLGHGQVLAVSLREPATPAEALRFARWVAADGEIATVVGRPVFFVGYENGHFRATPLSAGADGPVLVERAAAGELVASLCAGVSGCSPPPAEVTRPEPPTIAATPSPPTVASPAAVTPALEVAPPAKRPLWKRGWFWGVLATSVAAAVAVSVGVAVGVTAPSDYVVRVR